MGIEMHRAFSYFEFFTTSSRVTGLVIGLAGRKLRGQDRY